MAATPIRHQPNMTIEYTLSGFRPLGSGDDATAQTHSGYAYQPGWPLVATKAVAIVTAAALGWACLAEWRHPVPHVESNTTVLASPLISNGSVSSGYAFTSGTLTTY